MRSKAYILFLVTVPHVLVGAAADRVTAKERAQGFRDRMIVAKPLDSQRTRVDAEEAREKVEVRKKFPRLGDLRTIEVGAGEELESVVARLRATGRYEFVEPDYIRKPHALPNDPRFASGEQWHLRNTGQDNGTAGADIGAVAAWDVRTDASSVIVAVIDTGVRQTHEDLAANLWSNPREIPGNDRDDDGNGYVDDVHGINTLVLPGTVASGNPEDDAGHGSRVASVIGAVGNNGKGMAGIAWQVKIMALKWDDAEGSAVISNEIECIDYAIANGAHVINISYGGRFSDSEYAALRRARDAGIIVTTSAGNDGVSIDLFPEYPAGYLLDNIITVTATDRRDAFSDFGNYSVGLVDLAAPGSDLLLAGIDSDTAYTRSSGTSFSAPLVAGVLALLKAQFPSENYRSLMNRLLRSVDPLSPLTGFVQTGGRLNAARALSSTSARPFNDDFSARAPLTGGNIALRTNTQNATAETSEPAHAGPAAAGSLWWTWTASRNGTVAVETTGSSFDTVVAVYTGASLAALTAVTASDDATGTITSRTSFDAIAGTAYQIAVGGKGTVTGSVVFTLGYLPPNDAFTDAIELTGPSMRVTGFNTVSQGEAGEPKATPTARSRSVWYKWRAPTTDLYSVSVFSYGFNAVAAVYSGSSLGSLVPLETASTSVVNEAAFLDATAGVTYYIQIDSSDSTGVFEVAIVDGAAFPSLDPVHSSQAFSPATGYLVSADSFGFMLFLNLDTEAYKFDELDGTIEIHSPAFGPDGSMYVGDEFGYLYAYNPDLTRRWRKSLGRVRVTSSPSIGADQVVYVHTDDGLLHAYFPDGTLKWRTSVPGESYSTPSIGTDGTIYIGSEDENLYALSPLDGSLKWKFRADGAIYASVAIDAAGQLYFGTLKGKFYSLTAAGAQRWVYEAGGGISSSAAIGFDGTLYFGSYDSNLYAVSAAGVLQWKYATGDEIRASSPAIADDGVIYIGSYDGYIHAVTPFGTKRRTYATGQYIRSSPLIHEGYLYCGSGDGRMYAIYIGYGPDNTPWPMHRQNVRRTGRRALANVPLIVTPPGSRAVASSSSTTLAVNVEGQDTLSFQWQFNGAPITGATRSTYTIPAVNAASAGDYRVVITNSLGTTTTPAAIVGASTTTKLVGAGTEFPDIFHAGTGFTYDQILLEGASASVNADPGQILRISYIDLNNDIVQVEMSGPGTLSLALDGVSGPAPPQNYNQAVTYMKGHVGIVLSGADAATNLSVFSVGRANAANQALFRSEVTYDGFADIAFIAITSTDGKFGGLRSANASYFGTRGLTGIYAPGVQFTGPVFVGDIRASDSATPVIVLGSASDVRITGGDLLQDNGRAVQVSGITQLKFTAGSNSHGTLFPGQTNRARLEQNGIDVTSQIVVNPTP